GGGRGVPLSFGALIGMAVGYAAAVANGALTATDLQTVRAAPLLSPPGFAAHGWGWDASLVLPFAVAALANCVRTIGDVTICQKINDADWVRPDMRSISGGALANGLTHAARGGQGADGAGTHVTRLR